MKRNGSQSNTVLKELVIYMNSARSLTLLLMLMTSLSAPLLAWELPDDSSLTFVPRDTAVYASSFQLVEQWQTFANSRAFAKLKSLPLVQASLNQVKNEWETNQDFAALRTFLNQAENQELLRVMWDAVAQECFVYGNDQYGTLIGALNSMSNDINLAQLQAMVASRDPSQATKEAALKMLEDHPELLRVPSTLIGFRIRNKPAVEKQLVRLESLLQTVIAQQAPALQDHFSRKTLGNSEYLTLEVDGTLVPWKQLFEGADLDEATANKIENQLRETTASISIGIRGSYLLIAVSSDNSLLSELGNGDRLIDRKEMAPLRSYFSKNIYGIGFVSGEFLRKVSNYDHQIDQLHSIVKAALPAIPIIGDDVKTDIAQDADTFFAEMKTLQVKPGSVAAIHFGTPNAVDTVTYNWTQYETLDDSKPLTILEHVGGDPIGFYVARSKQSEKTEKFVRTWVVKLGQYIDRIGVPMMDDEQRDLYENVKENMLPLLVRLDVANREYWKPAFADGQMALVLDSKQFSRQWHISMPPAEEAVPLPELTVAWGVSDAAKVREGTAEYFDVLQAAIVRMSEIMPDTVPPIQIGAPRTKDTDAGNIYYYMIPPFLGLDPLIAPNAGLSENLLAISLVPRATQRILAAQSAQKGGVLASPDQPEMATAWQFKMNRFVQWARPWVKYGMQLAASEGVQDPEIATQISAVMDVLECIRTSSGYAYFKDGALFSHARTEFQDLN